MKETHLCDQPENVRHVLVLRHPETVASAEGRFIGRSESPFTARGEKQIQVMASRIRAWCPEVLYTSPCDRAREAARQIAQDCLEVAVSEDLAEIDFGALEGLTWATAAERGLVVNYGSEGLIAPGGEDVAAFLQRVRRAAEALATGPSRSAVITHGGVARELCAEWLAISRKAAWRIEIGHGCALGFKIGNGWATLGCLLPSPS